MLRVAPLFFVIVDIRKNHMRSSAKKKQTKANFFFYHIDIWLQAPLLLLAQTCPTLISKSSVIILLSNMVSVTLNKIQQHITIKK